MVPVTIDRSGRGEDAAHVGPLLGRAVKIAHLTRVPARQPLLEKRQLGEIGRRGDAAEIEAELTRFLLDAGC